MSLSSAFFIIFKVVLWTFQFFSSKIFGFLYGGPPKTTPPTKNYLLLESAASLANRIRNEKVTCKEVVEAFIDRIREVDAVFNCVVHERFDEALEEAAKVDERIRSGGDSKEKLEAETPLLGVPFCIEESIAVKGLPNTFGIFGRKGIVAEKDAEVVAFMRKAGAIPLACANVSEGCLSAETTNPLFGRTLNPYDTNRSAGGSSGGVACLVAAAGCPLGVASGNSTAVACAFSGVFGHKSFTDAGKPRASPVSKRSEDSLLAFKVLSQNSITDLKLDEPVDVGKLKYYYYENNGDCQLATSPDKETKEAIEAAINHFRNSLKAPVRQINSKTMKKAFFIWLMEKEKDHPHLSEDWDKKRGKLNICTEIFKAACGFSRHSVTFLLTHLIERLLRSYCASSREELSKDYSELLKELEDLLGSDGVLIWPTYPTEAFFHNEGFGKIFDLCYSGMIGALGLPHIHCPVGLNSNNLPVGFSVVAGRNQDRVTLAVAKEMEKVFGGWRPSPSHGTFTLVKAVLKKSNLTKDQIQSWNKNKDQPLADDERA